ncbi:oligosaccharide flippase family protein [Flavobacteriaceae bacterium]|nr:oligosaccharide flippase family protein [Flavobacteriaceae bacterium]
MNFRNLLKSDYAKNVLALVTGTTIAQAIPVAISPILTRLYSPDEFGVYALFLSITAIFGSIVAGRYEQAIILPKKDEDAISIFSLGLLITTFISILLLILVILFNPFFTEILENESIGKWLYFTPLVIFLSGLFNLLTYYNIRKGDFKDLAKATVIKSVVLSISQLILGFLKYGAGGLISGQILSQLSSNLKLFLNIIKDKVLLASISKKNIKVQAKRYKKFPLFSTWAVLANKLSLNLNNILISTIFSLSTLGIYSLVQKVLGMPTRLIGTSISQVFLKHATEEKNTYGNIRKSFNSTLKKLFVIGMPFFLVIFFAVEDLFVIVFGEEWRIGGTYAKILAPLFFVRFLSSTLSPVLSINEKQKSELYINIILLTVSLGLFIYFKDFLMFLYAYTSILSICYLSFLLYYYKLSK